MKSRVELFERIRRDREFEGLSVRALALRHGVHRRAVRQALGSALPPAKRRPVSRPAPALGPYRELIEGWLEADREAPPKQRHTAKRIHRRLVDEHGARVADTTVRDYVRRRRRELGLAAEAFCPQVHDPAVTAEVDWGEAKVSIAGALVTVGLFVMRSCFSGAAFVMAFATQSQQAFFEGHVAAFEFFGGVFETVRYDNLKAAAKKTLKGRRRVENDRLVALRSHYDGREVAHHPRLRGSQLRSALLEHYLELLQRKPGALRHSLALRQERERGQWPECFDRLWALIEQRVGASEAARQMVDVLMLCREHELDVVQRAVRGALAAGAHDGRAVALLARRQERSQPEALAELPERLQAHERPAPGLRDYDQLLEGEVAR